MGEHAIDGLKVLFGFIVEFLGLCLEFLEASFGVDIDSIFGMLTDVELLLELLRSLGGKRCQYLWSHTHVVINDLDVSRLFSRAQT